MDEQSHRPSAPNRTTVELLLAECRERIIDLEAHGLPDGVALWDEMESILAEMKRHQAPINPNG